MIKNLNVQSLTKPNTVEKGISSLYVYVRENIKEDIRPIGEDGETLTFYIYDELVYTKDEYKLIELEQSRNTQEEMLINLTYDMIMLQNNL